jgi:hypothetical protein
LRSFIYVASGVPVIEFGISLSIRKATRKTFIPASCRVLIADALGQV